MQKFYEEALKKKKQAETAPSDETFTLEDERTILLLDDSTYFQADDFDVEDYQDPYDEDVEDMDEDVTVSNNVAINSCLFPADWESHQAGI